MESLVGAAGQMEENMPIVAVLWQGVQLCFLSGSAALFLAASEISFDRTIGPSRALLAFSASLMRTCRQVK